MLGHEISHNRFKRIEIIQSILSDHNEIKLEINNRKKFWKLINMQKLNKPLLNNQWINTTNEIRKYFTMNENEDTTHENS